MIQVCGVLVGGVEDESAFKGRQDQRLVHVGIVHDVYDPIVAEDPPLTPIDEMECRFAPFVDVLKLNVVLGWQRGSFYCMKRLVHDLRRTTRDSPPFPSTCKHTFVFRRSRECGTCC